MAARLFCYLWGKTFLTRHVAGTSGRAIVNDIPPQQTSVAISCCASSKGQPFLKKQHLRESSLYVHVVEDANYFDSESTRIAQLTKEKQSGHLQQYNSLVQTFGDYYPSRTNTCREYTSSQRQPFPNKHPLQDQGRLRKGYKTLTESYEVLLYCLVHYGSTRATLSNQHTTL